MPEMVPPKEQMRTCIPLLLERVKSLTGLPSVVPKSASATRTSLPSADAAGVGAGVVCPIAKAATKIAQPIIVLVSIGLLSPALQTVQQTLYNCETDLHWR